jgi:GR25 family glycosyltransferase involved in LPS biosynthesis
MKSKSVSVLNYDTFNININLNTILLIVIIILFVIIIVFTIKFYLNNKSKSEHFTNPNLLNSSKNNGINNIDQILFINLDNRPDRLKAIKNQLKAQNVNMDKVHKISAHYTPGNGHYGCAKSHIDALKYALKNNYNNVLIFEDDFKFSTKSEETKKLFNQLFEKVPKNDWDVIMLTHMYGKTEKSPYSFLNKITGAQTASGYIINKNYYNILINTFQKCVDNMTTEKTTGVNWEQWALDQVWKENQKQDKWFVFNPLVGEQDSELLSTIQTITNYNT